MGLIHEDKSYALKIRESATDGSDFSSPEADYRVLFLGEDGLLHVKDSAGTVADPYSVVGGYNPTIVYKTADEVVNTSSTLQDDDHLLFAIGANEEWEFEFHLWWDTHASADFKFALTWPAAATAYWTPTGTELTAVEPDSVVISTSGTSRSHAGQGVGTIRHTKIHGVILNGANAGNVQLQWAQATSNASDATLHAGSSLKAWSLT